MTFDDAREMTLDDLCDAPTCEESFTEEEEITMTTDLSVLVQEAQLKLAMTQTELARTQTELTLFQIDAINQQMEMMNELMEILKRKTNEE